MNLKKFISKTMRDIDESINENPSVLGVRGTVHFDVAVIADETIEAGGGIQVLGVGKAGAKANHTNQVSSRIEFDMQTRRAISPAQSSPYNPPKKV